jgi:acyl-CoA reductase-like NAD-dependent aldehyde dehydrogenase
VERISHWIGGKVVPGESGRRGPVFDPAAVRQTHEVDLASAEEVGSAGIVGVNVPIPVPVASCSFGGWKQPR